MEWITSHEVPTSSKLPKNPKKGELLRVPNSLYLLCPPEVLVKAIMAAEVSLQPTQAEIQNLLPKAASSKVRFFQLFLG